MASALNSSNWVVTSEGKVISRGVTSCAGMTAQHVLLAQTKISFLTGGRGFNFQELTPADKQSQWEEAFARATVALTTAQRFCFIMWCGHERHNRCSYSIVGCLQHGAGVCDEQSTGSPLLAALKARSLDRSRDDNDFLDAFRHSATTKAGEFPPAALVEIYHEPGAVAARLRCLHLIIVDLCHPRNSVTRTEKQFYRQLATVHDTRPVGTTPIPLWRDEDWRYRYMLYVWLWP